MARRDLRIHDNSLWDPATWPKECSGAGFHEASRGALGHWVHIRDGYIANYQCVAPNTWNAGSRDIAVVRRMIAERFNAPLAHGARTQAQRRAFWRRPHVLQRRGIFKFSRTLGKSYKTWP